MKNFLVFAMLCSGFISCVKEEQVKEYPHVIKQISTEIDFKVWVRDLERSAEFMPSFFFDLSYLGHFPDKISFIDRTHLQIETTSIDFGVNTVTCPYFFRQDSLFIVTVTPKATLPEPPSLPKNDTVLYGLGNHFALSRTFSIVAESGLAFWPNVTYSGYFKTTRESYLADHFWGPFTLDTLAIYNLTTFFK